MLAWNEASVAFRSVLARVSRSSAQSASSVQSLARVDLQRDTLPPIAPRARRPRQRNTHHASRF
jgi:hypothetical protein